MKKQIRLILSFFLALSLVSCNSYDETNIHFFERISEIGFPKDLKVIETYDNAEYMCCGVFEISKDNLRYFKTHADFKKIRGLDPRESYIYIFPNNLLKDSATRFFPRSTMITWARCNHCTEIKIAIDTATLKMWCSAFYPDQSGDFCCNDTLQKNK